jgi:4-aminobutyrate aminotransferase / (S)-3-amino-2-methylpropionate transaminase / 5-aminovalerate transaminase
MNIAADSSVRLVTTVPGPRSVELQRLREAAVPRGVGSVLPVFIQRAHGAVLEDVDGNVFLDFTGGIGCQNAGHTVPDVVAAVQHQAEQFLHTCFMVNPYEGYLRLAEQLNARTPGSFPKKTFFLSSGAEAVENAIKIARNYTRRQAIIAFEDAFHGRTQLALSLTSKSHPYKTGFGPFAPEVYRMPYAYCYRCPYNLTHPECGVECANRLELTFQRQVEAGAVAAIIFEPVLGEGGFVVPPADWFPTIIRICRQHGILVIADEIQTGFCRTGPLFSCERFGIEPDLIVTGKSLAGGLPLAAVTGRAEIMDAPVRGGLGGTYGGNPVSCAAALQTLEAIDRLGLPAKSERIGRQFESAAKDWKRRFPLIGDVRGVGAMRALEIVKNQATKEPAPEETNAILAECHRRGLMIISAGTFGNVIRLLAPLVATEQQIDEGLNILEQAIAANCEKAQARASL